MQKRGFRHTPSVILARVAQILVLEEIKSLPAICVTSYVSSEEVSLKEVLLLQTVESFGV